MKSKKENTDVEVKNKEINFTKVGKTYYDIVDVLESKISAELVEKFSESVKKDVLEKIVLCVKSETTNAKSWGVDQIRKHF